MESSPLGSRRPPLPPRRGEDGTGAESDPVPSASPAIPPRRSGGSSGELLRDSGGPVRYVDSLENRRRTLAVAETASFSSQLEGLLVGGGDVAGSRKALQAPGGGSGKKKSSGAMTRSGGSATRAAAASSAGPPVPPRTSELEAELARLRPLAHLLMPDKPFDYAAIVLLPEADLQLREADWETRDLPDDFNFELSDQATLANGVLTAGTLNALVFWLTDHAAHDPNYMTAFFTTYRSFTTPRVLLRKLIARYGPVDLPNDDSDSGMKQQVIRLRVVQSLRHWIEKHPSDLDDAVLESTMKQFADSLPQMHNVEKVMQKSQMRRQIEVEKNCIRDAQRRLQKHQESLDVRLADCEKRLAASNKREGALRETPVPLLAPNLREPAAYLIDWPDLEVARQLSLIEFEYFARVEPHEFLNQNWSRANREQVSPNLVNFIGRFNTVGALVTSTLVQIDKIEDRGKMLRKWVHVAQCALDISNFSVMMSLVSALEGPAVCRLSATWATLPTKTREVYESLKALALPEKNFRALRDRTTLSAPPKVPYIGTALSDLTFIEDGNPDVLENSGFINFYKRQLLSQQIAQIQMWQQDVYVFQPVIALQNYLISFPLLTAERSYECSLSIEARKGTTNLKGSVKK